MIPWWMADRSDQPGGVCMKRAGAMAPPRLYAGAVPCVWPLWPRAYSSFKHAVVTNCFGCNTFCTVDVQLLDVVHWNFE